VAIDQTNAKIYYQCSQNGNCGGIQDNSDGTQTRLRFGPKVGSTRFTADAPLVIDPTNPSVLYIGGNVLDRAADRGATFTQISPSDPNDLPGPPPAEQEQDPVYANTYATISAIAPAAANPDPNGYVSTIYVGTDTPATCGRPPTPARPGRSKPGCPSPGVNSITVDPANANRAWVAFSGFRAGDDGSLLYETSNGGATWTSVSGILPNAPIEDVVFDRASNAIYVSTDLGVFWAHVPPAGGGHAPPSTPQWFRVGAGLPATPDMDLKINGSDTKLLAGTFGRGLWEVTLPTAKHG